MLEGVMAKKAVARSLEFVFWSLIVAVGLYLVTALVVLVLGLVSMTGWSRFFIETGGFLGYTMHLDNNSYVLIEPSVVIEPNLLGIIGLAVAVSLLIGSRPMARALRTSLRSWVDLG